MVDFTPGRTTRFAAVLLVTPLLVAVSTPAAAQQDGSTQPAPNSTTNLGTMVVAPQQSPGQNKAQAPKMRVNRHSLNINLGPILPAPGVSPKSTQPPPGHMHTVQQHVVHTPPRPIHVVSPNYPVNAYANGVKGSVTVSFTINKSGTTSHIHILHSAPPGIFDAAAEAAVRQWLFQPATENNHPVADTVSQTLVFRPPQSNGAGNAQANGSSSRHSGKPPADSVPGNIHPVHLVPPEYPTSAYGSGQGGVVTISFQVEPNGRTSHIRVVYAKPQHIFNVATENAVRQWRFKHISHPTKVVQTIRFTPPN